MQIYANVFKNLDMDDFLRKDKLWKWTQENVQNLNRSIPVTKHLKVIKELHSRKTVYPERF